MPELREDTDNEEPVRSVNQLLQSKQTDPPIAQIANLVSGQGEFGSCLDVRPPFVGDVEHEDGHQLGFELGYGRIFKIQSVK